MEFNLYFNNLKPETQAELYNELRERVENDPEEWAEVKETAKDSNISVENALAEKIDDIINRGFSLTAWVNIK